MGSRPGRLWLMSLAVEERRAAWMRCLGGSDGRRKERRLFLPEAVMEPGLRMDRMAMA